MSEPQRTVLICQSSSCLAHRGADVLAAFQGAELPAGVEVVPCDCLGQCNLAPNARVVPDEIWYCRLTPEDVPEIIQKHLEGGEPVTAKLHPRIHSHRLGFER